MLQRPQTLFLALTVVALGVFLGVPSWEKALTDGGSIVANPFYITHTQGGSIVQQKPVFYIATLAGLAAIFTIFTIFQYRNRVKQMLFVALNSLLMGIATSIMVYFIMRDATLWSEPTKAGQFGIGIWAAAVALVSNWLAQRFIKRDEKLVKDADRMR